MSTLLFSCAGARKPPAVQAAAHRVSSEPPNDVIDEYRKSARLPCAEGTDLVYVVDADGALHSFDPDSLRFAEIGRIDCGFRAEPHSMAVDRAGYAWVGFQDGHVGRVSIADATCSPTDIRPSPRPFLTFGMAFSPVGRDGSESLFIAGDPLTAETSRGGRGSCRRGCDLDLDVDFDDTELDDIEDFDVVRERGVLGRFDEHSRLVKIAPFHDRDVAFAPAELSSNADGKLFAFFTTTPATLAEIDPVSARVKSRRSLPSIRVAHSLGYAFAFAAVRDEFFFFWSNGREASRVTRLDGRGALGDVVKNAGVRVVGAGVSTCAGNKRGSR